jgi:hypothetical protein
MQWEYLIVTMNTRGDYAIDDWGTWRRPVKEAGYATINDLGEDGWELVSVDEWKRDRGAFGGPMEVATAVFKRRKGGTET